MRALAVNGTTRYVGGILSAAANQPRSRVAAFNTTTGQLLPWAPSADAEVSTLAVHPGTGKVFVGGTFGTVNGQAYRGVGIPDCIRSGEAAAESVARALAGARA